MNNCFPLSIKIPVKSNTVLLVVKLSGQNSLISQVFFVQVNPHKVDFFKVTTGETKSLLTIKCFNKNENNI